jgi:hypothetical protein
VKLVPAVTKFALLPRRAESRAVAAGSRHPEVTGARESSRDTGAQQGKSRGKPTGASGEIVDVFLQQTGAPRMGRVGVASRVLWLCHVLDQMDDVTNGIEGMTELALVRLAVRRCETSVEGLTCNFVREPLKLEITSILEGPVRGLTTERPAPERRE